jgi:nitrite reductase/ring-hydroxylating ferredoxin subunit
VADDTRLICPSADLAEGGKGMRFPLRAFPGEEKGFVVRHGGKPCAFVNQCPHLGTELDWQPGEFFDVGGLYLTCSTHGAIFEPSTGFCVAGPCRGASLEPLQVREENGEVFLLTDKAAPNSTSSSEAK